MSAVVHTVQDPSVTKRAFIRDGDGHLRRLTNLPAPLAGGDAAKRIYTSPNEHCVMAVGSASVDALAGCKGQLGSKDGSEPGEGSGRLDEPCAVAAAPNGMLYIADKANHSIRSFDGRTLTTVVGAAHMYTPTEEKLGAFRDGPAVGDASTRAQLRCPMGVAVAEDGRVFIADTGNHRIRMLSADRSTVTTVAGSGSGIGGYADGPALDSVFNAPCSIDFVTGRAGSRAAS